MPIFLSEAPYSQEAASRAKRGESVSLDRIPLLVLCGPGMHGWGKLRLAGRRGGQQG